jgi:hypothetical protein
MSRTLTVVLIYHCHKPVDVKVPIIWKKLLSHVVEFSGSTPELRVSRLVGESPTATCRERVSRQMPPPHTHTHKGCQELFSLLAPITGSCLNCKYFGPGRRERFQSLVPQAIHL